MVKGDKMKTQLMNYAALVTNSLHEVDFFLRS
jgi:hypothetical protein